MRRPLNIRTVKSTGTFYFEFGKGPTLLLGPQRKTVGEAEADKKAILGSYAECPRRLGRHLADFEAARRKAEELRTKFRTEEIGIQERLGMFYINCTAQGSTKHAFRFTREDAIQARSLLLDGIEVPWTPAESPRFHFLLQSHKQGVHFPVFVMMCGPPALEAEFAELFGRTALQRKLLSFPHVWVDCQTCSPAHLDARGAFQRCPWEEGTTVESVTEHVKAALDAARAKNRKELPLLVYLQAKVHVWLFRHAAGDTASLWRLFEEVGAAVVRAPHFSRLERGDVQALCDLHIGFDQHSALRVVTCRSKRQAENQFGAATQTELSRRLMGSAGFREHPENIHKRAREGAALSAGLEAVGSSCASLGGAHPS